MNVEPTSVASRGSVRAADPHGESLSRIEATLSRLEARLASLESQATSAVAIATDAFDGAAADARARGVDVDARVRTALRLLERVTEPSVAAALERGLELAPQAPHVVATLVDTFDGLIARARASGLDLDARAHLLAQAAERLTSPEALELLGVMLDRLDAVRGLLQSGVLDPAATRIVGTAGAALSETASEPVTPHGPWDALRALGDRDVRAALGFGLSFARNLGRHLAPARGALAARVT